MLHWALPRASIRRICTAIKMDCGGGIPFTRRRPQKKHAQGRPPLGWQ
jgi:hypothetical protein